jgi:hypothetical protein
MLIDSMFNGKPVHAFFSGDTIIDREYWGQSVLFKCFADLCNRFLDEHSESLYWLLLSKGFRTYLMLPIFFQRFHPAFNQCSRSTDKDLLDHLMLSRYGWNYHPDTGILQMDPPNEYLKPEFAAIPEKMRSNPHVGYFLTMNPGYTKGDELACICSLERKNFSKAGVRFLNST